MSRGTRRHDLAGERIEEGKGLDLVVEELDAHRIALRLRRVDVDDLATHAVGAPVQLDLVAVVLQLGEAPQDEALIHDVAPHQVQHHRVVGLGLPQPVDRGHGRDDERVVALEQRLRGGEAHLLDVLVDRGVLLDVGVRRGDIGLRLVVVVVRDEVLHRVVGEELPHLAVELRCQRLVRREDDGRPLHRLDHPRHAVGLAASRHAEQGLVGEPVAEPLAELAGWPAGWSPAGSKSAATRKGRPRIVEVFTAPLLALAIHPRVYYATLQ